MPQPASRLGAVAVHLPESTRSTDETERRLRDENPDVRPATGLIRRMTGVERVHVRDDGQQASDLAVAAARAAMRSPATPAAREHSTCAAIIVRWVRMPE